MELHFATGNPGKVDDAAAVLDDTAVSVQQLEVEVWEPQDASLEEVAEFKLEQALEQSQLYGAYVMADDSGLFVEELDGFPGILSSPFDQTVGRDRLLDLVDAGATASFRAAVAVRDPEHGTTQTFTGAVQGELVAPRGDDGFGYDPLFLPDGHEKTFAEDVDHKHEVSHRQEALEKLQDWIAGR